MTIKKRENGNDARWAVAAIAPSNGPPDRSMDKMEAIMESVYSLPDQMGVWDEFEKLLAERNLIDLKMGGALSKFCYGNGMAVNAALYRHCKAVYGLEHRDIDLLMDCFATVDVGWVTSADLPDGNWATFRKIIRDKSRKHRSERKP